MAANPWRIGSNTGKRGETRGEGEENGREGDVDEPLIQKTREISKKTKQRTMRRKEREVDFGWDALMRFGGRGGHQVETQSMCCS